MKKDTRKLIRGVTVFIISMLIVNVIYFLRDGILNWDYISLSSVGLLAYIVCGLIDKKSK